MGLEDNARDRAADRPGTDPIGPPSTMEQSRHGKLLSWSVMCQQGHCLRAYFDYPAKMHILRALMHPAAVLTRLN